MRRGVQGLANKLLKAVSCCDHGESYSLFNSLGYSKCSSHLFPSGGSSSCMPALCTAAEHGHLIWTNVHQQHVHTQACEVQAADHGSSSDDNLCSIERLGTNGGSQLQPATGLGLTAAQLLPDKPTEVRPFKAVHRTQHASNAVASSTDTLQRKLDSSRVQHHMPVRKLLYPTDSLHASVTTHSKGSVPAEQATNAAKQATNAASRPHDIASHTLTSGWVPVQADARSTDDSTPSMINSCSSSHTNGSETGQTVVVSKGLPSHISTISWPGHGVFFFWQLGKWLALVRVA